jgi:hypothetical protein
MVVRSSVDVKEAILESTRRGTANRCSFRKRGFSPGTLIDLNFRFANFFPRAEGLPSYAAILLCFQ